jgi:hypothetical protein
MYANVKDLPAAVRNEVKRSGLNCRKILVLCVGRGQAISDGSIVTTLADKPVERVPYEQGGGYRTQAAIFVVKGFGGGNYVGIVRPEGFPYSFKDAGTIAVAADLHMMNGEAA